MADYSQKLDAMLSTLCRAHPQLDERDFVDLALVFLDQGGLSVSVQDQVRDLLPRGKTVRWKS